MKIIFFGDSGTDSNRQRGCDDAGRVPEEYSNEPRALGSGYVFLTATQLYYEKPGYYQVLNRGIAGDRLPQLYARINLDVWREKPDVINIWVGGNDLPREKLYLGAMAVMAAKKAVADWGRKHGKTYVNTSGCSCY